MHLGIKIYTWKRISLNYYDFRCKTADEEERVNETVSEIPKTNGTGRALIRKQITENGFASLWILNQRKKTAEESYLFSQSIRQTPDRDRMQKKRNFDSHIVIMNAISNIC